MPYREEPLNKRLDNLAQEDGDLHKRIDLLERQLHNKQANIWHVHWGDLRWPLVALFGWVFFTLLTLTPHSHSHERVRSHETVVVVEKPTMILAPRSDWVHYSHPTDWVLPSEEPGCDPEFQRQEQLLRDLTPVSSDLVCEVSGDNMITCHTETPSRLRLLDESFTLGDGW